jgi:hypothetical protein
MPKPCLTLPHVRWRPGPRLRRWLVRIALVSGRDPVHLGRHETGVEDALRTA